MTITTSTVIQPAAQETATRLSQPIVVLSSSPLTERMLVYSDFAAIVQQRADLRIWSLSDGTAGCAHADELRGVVEPFPAIGPFKEFPYNYLRRLNDFAWDARLRPPSRVSMMRHVRRNRLRRSVLALRAPARAIAKIGLHEALESSVNRLLLSYDRSPEAAERLRRDAPSIVVTTGPHRYEEPAVVAAAKRLGIPTLALISSWDNISTKNRMPFQHDGYVVWSEQMRRELHDFYPASRDVPVYVCGAPQFDVFFQDRFSETRHQFCRRSELRPDAPIILYVLGSPNFLKEHHGARFLAERVARGELGDVQLIIRPHPLFDNGEERRVLSSFGPRVRVQSTGRAGAPIATRSQSEADILDWVSSFRHADVVVNLSSTATVDASIFDRPVVNLDYDPEPGHPNEALVRDVNHAWTHFKPVAESGGVWLVRSPDELVEAVRTYLVQPELHREQRQWIVEHVCGYADGACGHRLATAVLDFATRSDSKCRSA